jgi:hypothetical protein
MGLLIDTLRATSLSMQRQQKYYGEYPELSKISPKRYSISTIIRSYKSAVSKNIRKTSPHFAWQSRFYDRIIHDETDLCHTSDYI